MRYEHIIIGNGNLGNSLEAKLPDAKLIREWRYPESVVELMRYEPSVIWCCVGGGSVGADFNKLVQAHVHLTRSLLNSIPEATKLVFFSTDYVANEDVTWMPTFQVQKPKSEYALTKKWMEELILFEGRRNVACVRVGSLYGYTFPERCFPHKIMTASQGMLEFQLPDNKVAPTSTDWVAEVMAAHYQDLLLRPQPIHHLGPKDNCSLVQWGQEIFGAKLKAVSKGFDDKRPRVSLLRSDFAETMGWLEMWDKYKRE